jgi:glycerate 2-kinase
MYSPPASHPISHHSVHPLTVLNAYDAPDRRVESGSTEVPPAAHSLQPVEASEKWVDPVFRPWAAGVGHEGTESTVRIVIASDVIGALSSRRAGEVIASGWLPGAEVSVLPVGEAGAGFAAAYAELAGLTTSSRVADGDIVTTGRGPDTGVVQVLGPRAGPGIPYERSSWAIGDAIADLLRSRSPRRLIVDLAGLWVHDAGAGLLAALGATADRPLDRGVADLDGLSEVDLAPARRLLSETELVGVAPASQLSQPLLGLRGITSLVGREADAVPELMLRTDASLGTFAGLASPADADAPGAGACGGLGFAVLALGGQLSTGPALTLASAAGQQALRDVDLVVTGCSIFDFASRGGGVVAAMAEAAVAALSPCIVIAGEVLIGSREMRTMGVEAGYAVRESSSDHQGEISETELASTARRVARSWSW